MGWGGSKWHFGHRGATGRVLGFGSVVPGSTPWEVR